MHNRILKLICKIKKFYWKNIYKEFIFNKDLMFRHGFFIKILGGKIIIKRGCFFNNYCSINSLEYIEIGEDCIFGENVKIYDHNHKYSNEGVISKMGYNTAPIIIGDNVWVGSNSVILKGVTIGSNVVIGANSVIYKDIPSNSIVISKSNLEIRPMEN